MKKGLKRILLYFSSIFLMPLISALSANEVFSRGPEDLVNIVSDFFSPFFSALIGVDRFDSTFFARVLLLILVYIIVHLSLNKSNFFTGKPGVIIIVSAIVSILGARYLGEIDFIELALIPYGALTLALSIALPFLIFFFFVHQTMTSPAARRTAWIFFAVIFFGLWFTRKADLGELRWIYNIALLGVILSVAFDTKIHEYFGLLEAADARRKRVKDQLAEIEAKLEKYSAIANPSKTTKEVIEHLELRQKELIGKL